MDVGTVSMAVLPSGERRMYVRTGIKEPATMLQVVSTRTWEILTGTPAGIFRAVAVTSRELVDTPGATCIKAVTVLTWAGTRRFWEAFDAPFVRPLGRLLVVRRGIFRRTR